MDADERGWTQDERGWTRRMGKIVRNDREVRRARGRMPDEERIKPVMERLEK